MYQGKEEARLRAAALARARALRALSH